MSSQFARKQTEIADTALGMETKIKDGRCGKQTTVLMAVMAASTQRPCVLLGVSSCDREQRHCCRAGQNHSQAGVEEEQFPIIA